MAADAKRLPILADLAEADRELVLEECEARSAPAGSRIFSEGEAGGGLWWLLRGRVRVTSARHRLDAELEGAAALGALALVGATRHASVETLSLCELLHLGGDGFRRLVAGEPAATCRLLAAVAREAGRLLDECRADDELGVDRMGSGI